MRFGDLTYEEVRERASRDWLAIVPTGCTEQQALHLPVDFDTWFVEQLCNAASDRASHEQGVSSLVLPALPFGPTPEHRSYGSGYIDVPADVHAAVVSSVLTSLAEQGFRRIVVWRGCGAHDLRSAVERFNDASGGRATAFLPAHPYNDVWRRIADPSVPGGHADSFATSIALHLRPEAVRTDRIVDPQHGPVDWQDPDLDFGAYSRTGAIGDPTRASAELGAKLWEAVIDAVATTLVSIAQGQMDTAVTQKRLHFLSHPQGHSTR